MINVMKPVVTSVKCKKIKDAKKRNLFVNENIQKFQKAEQSRQNDSLVYAARFRANH